MVVFWGLPLELNAVTAYFESREGVTLKHKNEKLAGQITAYLVKIIHIVLSKACFVSRLFSGLR